MASVSQQYVDQYAEAAMEQMRLYGIPASITLAQGILESANGQSRLARNENNHFGIKATKAWIDGGGKYGLYTDDKPNEKFCSYDSVADSYAHHSRFLKENSRYSACFTLAADDYKGWAQGLDRAGYATAGKYAPSLISVIERMNLQKYDQMVMQDMAAKGLKPGQGQPQSPSQSAKQEPNNAYSFPLKRDEFLFVSSKFGNRVDPMDHSKTQFHKGIDIRCNNEALLATENNGRVVSVNHNAGTSGGKSVTLEYDRADGTKYQVYYCHMSSIAVKVGDTVNAGQQIGVSGNTGTRTTGPHLHLSVKQISADGTKRDIDPAAYLAEIAQRGNISLTAMYNGKDLLQKYKEANPLSPDQPLLANDDSTPEIDTELSPDEWMKKLLSSEDSGVNMGGHGDPVMEMVMTMFTSLMALAVAIDNKSEEEAMELATDAALNRSIDLTSLTPGLRQCVLTINEGRNPTLSVNDGSNSYSVELTSNDLNRINLILQDSGLSNEEKQSKISGLIGNIVLSAGMSQNYQQGVQQDRSEQLSIK